LGNGPLLRQLFETRIDDAFFEAAMRIEQHAVVIGGPPPRLVFDGKAIVHPKGDRLPRSDAMAAQQRPTGVPLPRGAIERDAEHAAGFEFDRVDPCGNVAKDRPQRRRAVLGTFPIRHDQRTAEDNPARPLEMSVLVGAPQVPPVGSVLVLDPSVTGFGHLFGLESQLRLRRQRHCCRQDSKQYGHAAPPQTSPGETRVNAAA
jgi:hypothetical protein